MTIFGDWLRQRNRNIARAMKGDGRAAAQLEAQDEADPLGIDLEATRLALVAGIEAEKQRRVQEAHELAQERKEQSIIAALVFGCSCGSTAPQTRLEATRGLIVGEWLRQHSHCAGLGAMVREDA